MAIILDPIGGAPAAGGGGGRTGALSTTSAVDIILVTESEALQRIAMTAIDKSVFLPTGIPAGPSVFMITNVGDIPFAIRSPQGAFLATAEADTVSIVSKYGDDSWSVAKLTSETQAAGISTSSIFNAARSDGLTIELISLTQAVVIYYTNTATMGAVLDISGTTVTMGTPITVSVNYSTFFAVTKLNATQVLLGWSDGLSGAYRGYAAVATVSGSTLSMGTPLEYNPTAYTGLTRFTTISPTQVLSVYHQPTGYPQGMFANLLNIAGTTVTATAQTVIIAGHCTEQSIAQISATKVLLVYRNITTMKSEARILTLTPTTITSGAVNAYLPYITSGMSIAMLSDTTAIISYRNDSDGSKPTAALLTVAGDVVTISNISGAIAQYRALYCKNVVMAADRVVLIFNNQDANISLLYSVLDITAGGTIVASTPTEISPNYIGYHSPVILSDTQILIAMTDKDQSSYGKTTIIELGAL